MIEKLYSFIQKKLPPLYLKELGDKLFLISFVCFTLCGMMFGMKEGFVCLLSSIAFYLCSIEFNDKRNLLLRAGYILVLSIISVSLNRIDSSYLLIVAPLYTFTLVNFEINDYYKGVPVFFLPLVIYIFNLDMGVDSNPQRIITIFIGIGVALATRLYTSNSIKAKDDPALIAKGIFSRSRVIYAARKSLGIGVILAISKFLGKDYAIWGAYLFICLHGPIDTGILPKISKRLGGTILGAFIYLPIGYFIDSPVLIYLLALASLYLALIFIGHCYFTTAIFITMNYLFFSGGFESFGIVFGHRILFTVIGSVVAIIVSLILPLKECVLQINVE